MSCLILDSARNNENTHNVMHGIEQNPGKHIDHEWIFVRLYLT